MVATCVYTFRAGYVFEDNVSRRHQRGREQAMVEDPTKVSVEKD